MPRSARNIVTLKLMQEVSQRQQEFASARCLVFEKYELAWRAEHEDPTKPAYYVPVEGPSHQAEPPTLPDGAQRPKIVVRVSPETDAQSRLFSSLSPPLADNTPPFTGIKKDYDPLEAPGLFLTFARLLEKPIQWWYYDVSGGLIPQISDDALLAWVHQYGLLNIRNTYSSISSTGPSPQQVYDSLAAVHEEIAIARQLLSLYEACATRDYEDLRRRIFEGPVHPQLLALLPKGEDWCGICIDGRPTSIIYEKPVSHWEPRDFLHTVHYRLLEECVEHFAPVSPDILKMTLHDPSEEPDSPFAAEVKSGWYAKTLLSAMYLQLWSLITESTPMRRCKYCGKLFFVTKGDQEYCPHPLGGGRQSLCSKKAWYHRHKSNQHTKKGGDT